MTSFILDPIRGAARRISRAIRERSALSFFDRHVTLASQHQALTRSASTVMRAAEQLVAANRGYAGRLAESDRRASRLEAALAEIAGLPKTVKIANGTTRKAARIAREAMVA